MILTVGLSCWDQFFLTHQVPKENNKGFAFDFMESGGGPTGNASWLLGKWGETIYHISTLRQDSTGDKILRELQDVGVNCSYCLIDDKQVSPLSSIFVNVDTATRTIVTHKNLAEKYISPDYYKKLDELIDKLNNCGERVVVLIDGHEQEITEYILPKLTNKVVVMDAGNYKDSLLALSKFVNYLVSSEAFIEGLLGLEHVTEAEFEKGLKAISEISAPENTPVVTLGDRGVAYLRDGKLSRLPSYQCTAVDTTGAGDIYHGAFVYGIAHGWNLEKIIQFSALTSAISIEKAGVRNSIPSLEQVIQAWDNKTFKLREKPNLD